MTEAFLLLRETNRVHIFWRLHYYLRAVSRELSFSATGWAGWRNTRGTTWPPPREGVGGLLAAGHRHSQRKGSHAVQMSSRLTFPLELCQGTLEESRPPPFPNQCCLLASIAKVWWVQTSLALENPSVHSTPTPPIVSQLRG